METQSGDKTKLRDAIVKEAYELYLDKGFNCAESIMLALTKGLEMKVPAEVIRSTTPLGGGIGQSGEACGALTAGVLVMGLLYGRTEASADKTRAGRAGRAYRDRFAQTLGATQCRDLNFMDYTSPDHRPRCSKIVSTAAGLLFDVIEELDQNV